MLPHASSVSTLGQPADRVVVIVLTAWLDARGELAGQVRAVLDVRRGLARPETERVVRVRGRAELERTIAALLDEFLSSGP